MLKRHRCLVSVRLVAAHLRAPIVVTSRVMLPFLAPMVREKTAREETQPQNLGSSDSVTFLQTLFRKKKPYRNFLSKWATTEHQQSSITRHKAQDEGNLKAQRVSGYLHCWIFSCLCSYPLLPPLYNSSLKVWNFHHFSSQWNPLDRNITTSTKVIVILPVKEREREKKRKQSARTMNCVVKKR